MNDINYNIPLKLIYTLANGEFYFINQLSTILSVNEIVIFNNIRLIKYWGLEVLFMHNKGYGLKTPIQLLNKDKIFKHLEHNNINLIPVVNSTNQYLLDNIQKLNSSYACIAEYQTHGRGRFGNSWYSPFGVNLYISMYWKFRKNIYVIQNGLSIMVGIVIARILKQIGTSEVKIKWPNDIYVKNKKLSGILIELSKENIQAIIGIGININMSINQLLSNQQWISLKDVGINIDRNILAAIIINTLRKEIYIFEHQGLFPFMNDWLILDMYLNKKINLFLNDNTKIIGIGRGIDQHGRLLFEHDGKVTSFIHNRVSLFSRN